MKRFNTLLTVLVVVVGGLFYFSHAARSAADMSEGRYVLHMDHWISYDAVKKILYPKDFKDFRHQIADGDEHRYGRVMFNYIALVAYIPEKISGEKGLITASRLAMALAQFAGFVLLVIAFLRAWYTRALLLALLISLPHTVYFFSMPKPEPVLLFFLGVFFYFAVKNEFRFGAYWIFLGLAFGAKISVLPIIPLLAGLAVLRLDGERPRLEFPWKAGLKAFFFFLLGQMLAIPMLFRGYYAKWINWTFKNTGHGADNVSVTWRTWLDYFITDWSGAPKVLFILILLVLMGAVVYAAVRYVLPMFRGRSVRFPLELVLIAFGLALTLPVALTVKRVWGYYLHIGLILIMAGMVVMIERRFVFETGESEHAQEEGTSPMWKRLLPSMVPLLALLLLLPFNFKVFDARARIYATGSENAEHKEKLKLYNDLVPYFRRVAAAKKWTIQVLYDPRLYPPESDVSFTVKHFWGPMRQWKAGVELIVTWKDTVLGYPLPAKDNAEYKTSLQAREQLAKHTAKAGQKCAAQPCYRRVGTDHPTLRVYLRADLFDAHPSLRVVNK